jgi:hypothetical protein
MNQKYEFLAKNFDLQKWIFNVEIYLVSLEEYFGGSKNLYGSGWSIHQSTLQISIYDRTSHNTSCVLHFGTFDLKTNRANNLYGFIHYDFLP